MEKSKGKLITIDFASEKEHQLYIAILIVGRAITIEKKIKRRKEIIPNQKQRRLRDIALKEAIEEV